jgi:hypothetical protein
MIDSRTCVWYIYLELETAYYANALLAAACKCDVQRL